MIGRRPDEVWEHKRGKVWRVVEKLEHENRVLRWQLKVLRARLATQRRFADSAFKEAERYRQLAGLS